MHKWKWTRHIVRTTDNRCIETVTEWYPRDIKRKPTSVVGRRDKKNLWSNYAVKGIERKDHVEKNE